MRANEHTENDEIITDQTKVDKDLTSSCNLNQLPKCKQFDLFLCLWTNFIIILFFGTKKK